MTSMAKGAALAGALCVMTGTLQAADGLLIVQKTTGGAAPQTHQFQIEKTRMRAESAGPDGTIQAAIFDGTKQVMTIVDPGRKTYSEMTQADVEKLAAQVSDAMAMMKKQMESMPPEQRIPGMTKPTYKKAGTAAVGKWTCDRYEGFEGEKKTSEVCTVDPRVFGASMADFEVTKQMAAFFSKVMPSAGADVLVAGSPGFPGVPVRSVHYFAGREIVSEVTEVSRQTFADATFAVPAGFQKTQFGPRAPR